MSQALAPLRHNPRAGHPLIEGAEGLTPEWITAVLRARGIVDRASVRRVTQAPIGNGMLGLNLRLALEYDAPETGVPASLVAKMASTRAESRESGAALGLYERETRFYQEIAPGLDAGLPQTLFADISGDGRNFCMLFEDLSPARGGDQLAGCSVEDAASAMDAAAALHAPLWGDRKLLDLPWVNREFMVSMYIDKLPPFVPVVATRFAALLEPGVIGIAERFGACIGRYFDLHAMPWTITHQDFRLDNMLFDARGGRLPVAVLDWQTFLPGPGALDVTYFLGAGLLPPVRRKHERALAERYHQNLVARGVKDYGWDRCWHDYRLHAAHGLIMAIVGAAITASTERGDRMLSTMINRHAMQMIDLDTLSLIESVPSSPMRRG
ncbi:MAG: phosphotransferase [Panacagrimonas sp.]